MSSKKIGGCIVHGLKLPSGCSTRRIRHPELIYEPPSLNSGMEPDCLESEYVNIPPVPYYKAKWKVCQPSKSLKPYCPPSPCVCPPKPVIIPLRHRLKNLFWTSVKLALFVGIVKVTDDLRIWSTSDETESLYFNVQETISPAEPEGDIIQESEVLCSFYF